ncbi:MAG: hypothetical protein KJ956_04725 [Actinobacteria bacterium]|nr:hypothetical protein [Actinomycetota bacterium]
MTDRDPEPIEIDREVVEELLDQMVEAVEDLPEDTRIDGLRVTEDGLEPVNPRPNASDVDDVDVDEP